MDKFTVICDAAGSASAPSQTSFEEQLAPLQKRVERRLTEIFPQDQSGGLRSAIAHGLLSPGKRLRPLITMLACRQCGGDPLEALNAACAVEMVHAASLIVDDLPCMDDARLRRNGEATHIAFGESTSILASIALVNEAFGVIARMQTCDPQRRVTVAEKLSQSIGVNGLAGGQERDLLRETENHPADVAEIEQSHLEKTGALFAAAAGIGAVIAGARTVEIDAMEGFGSALGLAYQTFDDVIDAQCDASETGKDAGADENRTTVVTMIGAAKANKSGAFWLDRAIQEAGKVDTGAGTPLVMLARLIEMKFSKMKKNA
ncbi:polyprenyl synthetase family protein [Hyphococcus sp.]|uniref:polyprenyl synthetase family protein n=1 Tax=Hyphococcus sp. TaxID=2038636 RepID=UPI003CCB89FF